jgi:hypothetical protein
MAPTFTLGKATGGKKPKNSTPTQSEEDILIDKFRQTVSLLTLITAFNNNGCSTLHATPPAEPEYSGPLDLRQRLDKLVVSAVSHLARRGHEVAAAAIRYPRSVTLSIEESDHDEQGMNLKGSEDDNQLDESDLPYRRRLEKYKFFRKRLSTSMVENEYGDNEHWFQDKPGAFATLVPEGDSCWGKIRSEKPEDVFSIL